ALVADPRAVDLRVFARRHALDADVLTWIERIQLPFRLAMPDVDRAAARAARADGRRGLQVPDAGLVQERAGEQCADRAEVDDVVRVRIGVEREILRGAHRRRLAAPRVGGV